MIDIDFDIALALKLSEIVQEKCIDVPHDIGVVLAREVFLHSLQMAGEAGSRAGEALRGQFCNEHLEQKR